MKANNVVDVISNYQVDHMSNRCEFTIYIVPLHQTTANLHPAVGGLSHLVANCCNSDEDWRVENKTYWLGRCLNIWNTLDKSVARGVARAG